LNMPPASEDIVRRRQEAYEAWLSALGSSAYRIDFYQAMRRFASAHPLLPALGEALRPKDEPLRVGQAAELDFAPTALHSLERTPGKPPRLMQRVFGLLGPNGALPLHITEYVRERAAHHGDVTLQRFLDMLTHRFALLFYRAWAEAQPTVSLDRPGNKATFNRVGALIGIGLPGLQDRDALPDANKLNFVGRLSRQTRDADGLLAWCRLACRHRAVERPLDAACGRRAQPPRAPQRGVVGSQHSDRQQRLGRAAQVSHHPWASHSGAVSAVPASRREAGAATGLGAALGGARVRVGSQARACQ
jgi:type VI secretion system protein ImpH